MMMRYWLEWDLGIYSWLVGLFVFKTKSSTEPYQYLVLVLKDQKQAPRDTSCIFLEVDPNDPTKDDGQK